MHPKYAAAVPAIQLQAEREHGFEAGFTVAAQQKLAMDEATYNNFYILATERLLKAAEEKKVKGKQKNPLIVGGKGVPAGSPSETVASGKGCK